MQRSLRLALALLAALALRRCLRLACGARARGRRAGPAGLGDSISAGYGLARRQGLGDICSQSACKRAGYPYASSTRRSAATRPPAAAPTARAAAQHSRRSSIIELGGNDALRGGNLDATRANLDAMVAAAQAAGARVLLVGMQLPPNYGPAYVRAFGALFADVAKARKVPRRAVLVRRLRRRPRAVPGRPHPSRPPPRSRACSTTSGRRSQPLLGDGTDDRRCRPRPPPRPASASTSRDLARFADRIDVRSPAEFADRPHSRRDQPAGARRRRARARSARMLRARCRRSRRARLGAAIVARNIARHRSRPTRATSRASGDRSCTAGAAASAARALAHVLRGDRLARRAARRRLSRVSPPRRRRAARAAAARCDLRVVCGLTGSGKSRLLARARGARRAGARPRGARAPSRLAARRPARRPAAVAEGVRERSSRRARARSIARGPCSSNRRASASARCSCPIALLERDAHGARACASRRRRALRVALLKDEYAHFLADPDALCARLAHLVPLHGNARRSRAGARPRAPATSTRSSASCSTLHYDPLYLRSIERNFPRARRGASRSRCRARRRRGISRAGSPRRACRIRRRRRSRPRS